ncbi:MAG: DUF47 family protein [Candidatus Odinarchaeum yellowstonii]|uniref:DUF47 family protein n=1 Tax=Odinarchaeota yellowstonii (strain LCB_4) TaxID=1841599 RepID=A0AAF0D2S4_ODILC|nr:MAG: DUF47 family protein [Candidatus Odinarchaeum yellowstonii]
MATINNNEAARSIERKALYISQDHSRVILTAVKELSQLIDDWIAGDLEGVREHHNTISKLEKEANNIKWSLLDELSTATTLICREDLMRLVLETDMIADNVEAVAYKINIAGNMELPSNILKEFKKMMETVVITMDKLRECIISLEQNIDKAAQLSKQVDEVEEQTDAIHRALMKDILDEINDHKKMYKISNIIEQLEETSDQIKSSADMVRILTMSIRQ